MGACGQSLCQALIYWSLSIKVNLGYSYIIVIYYSTMMSFYHIWSRERAKYETVIHCSVPV